MQEEATEKSVDEQLLEIAKGILTPEIEAKTQEIVTAILSEKNIPFDYSHISSFIEGIRLVGTQIKEESEQEVSILVMALLRVKENMQNNVESVVQN